MKVDEIVCSRFDRLIIVVTSRPVNPLGVRASSDPGISTDWQWST